MADVNESDVNKPTKQGIPRRELRDPRTLRAFAHPMRLRILEELAVRGPATATQLAARVGESAANCSWHLRQLAQHGFIEEAEGGTGRQRPWRFVLESTGFGDPDEGPEMARAGAAAEEVLLGRVIEALRAWNAAKRSEPRAWQEASFVGQALGWLTAEELKAFGKEVFAIWTRHADRLADPSRRPPGARPVRLVNWGFPMQPESDRPDPDPDPGSDPPGSERPTDRNG